jgi:AcrR family transcriptional regulator
VALISGPARKSNRRGEGARLRDEIVQAAIRLVEEYSDLGGTTLRAVARRAGITAPSIYAHFGTLDDVIDAVVASIFEELARNLERDLRGDEDPRSAVACPVSGYVSFGAGNPRLYRLLFSHDRPPPTPLVRQQFPLGIEICLGQRMAEIDEGSADAAPVLLLHGNPAWGFLWRHVF